MGDKCKIFVGNISFETDEEDLRKYFEEFGDVEEVIIVLDRESGKSRGFGFITFKNVDGAEKAVESCKSDPISCGGRTLSVNKANPRTGGGGGGGGARSYNRDQGYGGGSSYRNRSYGSGGGGGYGGRSGGYGGGYGGGGGGQYYQNGGRRDRDY